MRASALVLDVGHRCWLVDGKLPSVEVGPGQRPLAALSEHVRAAVGAEARLLGPFGPSPAADPCFAFLLATPSPAALGFTPLAAWASDAALAPAWTLYVEAMLGGWQPPTRALECCYFGDEPALAAQLAHQIMKGKKRATSGHVAVAEHEGWSLPGVGTISIITDGFGIPLCAIQTERTERGRFGDAGEEIARAEGEDDQSLERWREVHQRYFAAHAMRLGLRFDDDSIVFHEYFRLVAVFGRTD